MEILRKIAGQTRKRLMGLRSLAGQARARLLAMSVTQRVQLAYTLVLLLLLLPIYHFWGNTQDIERFGRSAWGWLQNRWSGSGGDFSHGWLIPWISLFFIWRARAELWDSPKRRSLLGLLLIVAGLALHWVGYRAQLVRLSLLSVIVLFFSIPFYVYGAEVARRLLFPCAYLFFCIPLSFLKDISFPLRLFATRVGCGILNTFGLTVVRHGTRIFQATISASGARTVLEHGFKFEVADPCSGLRSLVAMLALAAAYAHVSQRGLIRKWTLFLGGIPLAIAGNIARIITIFIVAAVFGQQAAIDIYHDWSGFILFAVAILLMIGFGRLLNMPYREVLAKWKKKLFTPSSLPLDSSV